MFVSFYKKRGSEIERVEDFGGGFDFHDWIEENKIGKRKKITLTLGLNEEHHLSRRFRNYLRTVPKEDGTIQEYPKITAMRQFGRETEEIKVYPLKKEDMEDLLNNRIQNFETFKREEIDVTEHLIEFFAKPDEEYFLSYSL